MAILSAQVEVGPVVPKHLMAILSAQVEVGPVVPKPLMDILSAPVVPKHLMAINIYIITSGDENHLCRASLRQSHKISKLKAHRYACAHGVGTPIARTEKLVQYKC